MRLHPLNAVCAATQSNVDDLEDASNELMLADDDQVLLLLLCQPCCRRPVACTQLMH